MELDWKLKGSNLLKFNCNKESVVHPETCTKMVQMDHDSNKSLYDWITNNDTTDLKSCLGDWIDTSIIEVIYTPTYQSLDDSNSMLFGTINNTPVRIPFGTRSDASTPLFGVFKAGNGFSVDNGILNVGVATSDVIGGIKTGYPSSGLNKAVELDQKTQQAFVNLSGISVNSTIKSWYKTTEFSSENLPKTYHVQTHDKWANYRVEGSFNTLFNNVNPTESSRIYPICQDTEGKMFTFVPWSDTTYGLFNDTNAGIVPSTENTTNKSTKFLNAVGNWTSVPYSSLTGTPNVLSSQSHSSNTNYLIKGSGYSTMPTKYLKEDGTWDVPADTTYNVANSANSQGLLSVAKVDLTADTAIEINPDEAKTLIPIAFDKNYGVHGITVDTIISVITDIESNKTFMKQLTETLVKLIGNYPEIKQQLKDALDIK